jgi:TonB-dependent SusC/RagA subfamily outer membrane receptor
MRHRASLFDSPPHVAFVAVVVILPACNRQPILASTPQQDSVQVGYGSQAKRDVTGSVASVDGDVARRNNPTSVADMIDGRFPGVEVRRLPSGGISVRIRGSRSLNSDQEPLYVIDGVPQRAGTGGTLSDLDPHDIKSIDVLKDAAATSIYGSRGANGVVLITMKRPEG